MAGQTKIEWTEVTWNPIAGCSVISPGCKNCYAMKMAARLEHMGQEPYRGLTQPSKAGPVWTGKIWIGGPEHMKPLRWKKPRRIFVNSMSDLFHEGVPDEAIDAIFAVMAMTPKHTYQVLTKRADRMRDYCRRREKDWVNHLPRAAIAVVDAAKLRPSLPSEMHMGWPLPNVWLGVSVENELWAQNRIPLLLQTPAAVRWISAEPLLNPIDLEPYLFPVRQWSNYWANNYPFEYPEHRLDWVVVGGESGPGARPMHPDWARNIRDQCVAAGVPFFFKQWGAWVADDHLPENYVASENPLCIHGANFDRLGKKAAGRLLDGRTWDEYPKVAA